MTKSTYFTHFMDKSSGAEIYLYMHIVFCLIANFLFLRCRHPEIMGVNKILV